jgi:hypothetical protein
LWENRYEAVRVWGNGRGIEFLYAVRSQKKQNAQKFGGGASMERMWVLEAAHKYPKQWFVAVNLSWEPESVLIGDIYLVTPDKGEAFTKFKELKDKGDMGEVSVFEGYDDTPQIGGLARCSR